MHSDSDIPPAPDQQLDTVRRQLGFSWILMLLLVGILLFPIVKSWFGFGVGGEPRTITPRGALADFEQTTVDIFRETSPSVVFITTKEIKTNRFGNRVESVEAGTGTGFVWDREGHIITNFHVLADASSAEVVFADQSVFPAKLVGWSPDNDLAVLKIDTAPDFLRPVQVGESDDLVVGQSVFAIGNPFGLQQTLTTGVVSAKSRTIRSPSNHKIEDVIQIDAAINPGNSGGPLLDSAGRLIGVNTSIYSPSGASAGVGFSIPVDTVNRVVPSIIANGKYEPPQLGVQISEQLSVAVARRTGVTGAAIAYVVPDGPAARAGLRGLAGIAPRLILEHVEVILTVNDRAVKTVGDIQNEMQKCPPGEPAILVISQNGQESVIEVQLDPR